MSKTANLSKEAEVRLAWLGHYKKHKNASVTCRRFGISRSALYKGVKRYIERGPPGLEGLSRAPKGRRVSPIPRQTIDLIVAIRTAHPAWSKHKISAILAQDHGIRLSASTAGRIMKRKGLYDRKISHKKARAAKGGKGRLRSEGWMKRAFPGRLIQTDAKRSWFGNRRSYRFTAMDRFPRIFFCRAFPPQALSLRPEVLRGAQGVYALLSFGPADRRRRIVPKALRGGHGGGAHHPLLLPSLLPRG